MEFDTEAKEICHMVWRSKVIVPDDDMDDMLISYVANKLEIAYTRGAIKKLDEFKKMGTPMEKLDENK